MLTCNGFKQATKVRQKARPNILPTLPPKTIQSNVLPRSLPNVLPSIPQIIKTHSSLNVISLSDYLTNFTQDVSVRRLVALENPLGTFFALVSCARLTASIGQIAICPLDPGF